MALPPLGNRATGILDFLSNTLGMDDEEKRRQMAMQQPPMMSPAVSPYAPIGNVLADKAMSDRTGGQVSPAEMSEQRMMQSPMPMQQPQESSPDQIKGKIAETAARQMAAGGDKDPAFMDKVKGYFGDEGNMLRLAMAFNTMRMEPDQQLAAYAAKRLESMQAQKTAQSQAQGIAQQLAQMGYKEHAMAALSNPALAKDIYNAVVKSKLDTGAKSTIGKLQQDLSAGRITQEQFDAERKRLEESGKTIVNLGEGSGWSDKVNDTYITRFNDFAVAGNAAARNVQLIDALDQSLANVPTGAQATIASFAGSLGLKSDYASDLEAAEAIISQLVPQQRPPGSGVMSDADLALFKKSLPNIMNTPGGNMKIMQTIREMAMYDIKRGQIADRAMWDQEYSPQQAVNDINALGDPLGWLKQSGLSQTEQPAATPGVRNRKYDANGNLITQ